VTYPDINEIQITVSDNSIEQRIESELLKSLRTELTQSTNSNLVLAAKDSKGNLIGGLAGSISYGWLLVKLLWVSDKFQELGIGRSLMDKAESEAFNYDCHSVWLDTSNPKAMKFYSSLGYETFGQLSNKESQHPNDHSRWFMKKQLKGGRAELNLS